MERDKLKAIIYFFNLVQKKLGGDDTNGDLVRKFAKLYAKFETEYFSENVKTNLQIEIKEYHNLCSKEILKDKLSYESIELLLGVPKRTSKRNANMYHFLENCRHKLFKTDSVIDWFCQQRLKIPVIPKEREKVFLWRVILNGKTDLIVIPKLRIKGQSIRRGKLLSDISLATRVKIPSRINDLLDRLSSTEISFLTAHIVAYYYEKPLPKSFLKIKEQIEIFADFLSTGHNNYNGLRTLEILNDIEPYSYKCPRCDSSEISKLSDKYINPNIDTIKNYEENIEATEKARSFLCRSCKHDFNLTKSEERKLKSAKMKKFKYYCEKFDNMMSKYKPEINIAKFTKSYLLYCKNSNELFREKLSGNRKILMEILGINKSGISEKLNTLFTSPEKLLAFTVAYHLLVNIKNKLLIIDSPFILSWMVPKTTKIFIDDYLSSIDLNIGGY